jgi:SAM-dependent methyltransferase
MTTPIFTEPAILRDRGVLTTTQLAAINNFNAKRPPTQNYPCICGKPDSAEDVQVATLDRFGIETSIVLCNQCGMIRANPYYTSAGLGDFYENHYRDIYDAMGTPEEIFPGQLQRGALYRTLLAERSIPYHSVLDVGCGAGGVLIALAGEGVDAVGYDVDERYLQYGRSKSDLVTLKTGTLEDAVGMEGRKFDLIIVSHVVEHVPQPSLFIAQLAEMLGDGGVIVVAVPGNRCIFNREAYEFDYRWYLVNAHCWYFTHEHLNYLFATSGFSTAFSEECGLHSEDVVGIYRRETQNLASPPKPPALSEVNLNILARSRRLQNPIRRATWRLYLTMSKKLSNAIRRVR